MIEAISAVTKSRHSPKIQPGIPKKWCKGITIEAQYKVHKNKKQQNQIQDPKHVQILSHVRSPLRNNWIKLDLLKKHQQKMIT